MKQVQKSINTQTLATPEQKKNREEKAEILDKIVENKNLTRRKIIVGGTILKAIESDHVLKLKLMELLEKNIYRDSDREMVADLMKSYLIQDNEKQQ